MLPHPVLDINIHTCGFRVKHPVSTSNLHPFAQKELGPWVSMENGSDTHKGCLVYSFWEGTTSFLFEMAVHSGVSKSCEIPECTAISHNWRKQQTIRDISTSKCSLPHAANRFRSSCDSNPDTSSSAGHEGRSVDQRKFSSQTSDSMERFSKQRWEESEKKRRVEDLNSTLPETNIAPENPHLSW